MMKLCSTDHPDHEHDDAEDGLDRAGKKKSMMSP